MTLIDKDALVKQFDGNIEYFTADETIEMIDNVPTIEAVEVVRCKDCEYYPEIDCFGNACCNMFVHHKTVLIPRKPDDFCSYGRKKEGL